MALPTYYNDRTSFQPEIEVYYTKKSETATPPQVIQLISPDYCWSRYYKYASDTQSYHIVGRRLTDTATNVVRGRLIRDYLHA